MGREDILAWEQLLLAVKAKRSACIQAEPRRKAVLAIANAIAPLLRSCDVRETEEFIEGYVKGKCVIAISKASGTVIDVKMVPGDLQEAEEFLVVGLRAIELYKERKGG